MAFKELTYSSSSDLFMLKNNELEQYRHQVVKMRIIM